VCGEEDPLEGLTLTLLDINGDAATLAVENISDQTLEAGVRWRASSEKNDVHGDVDIGSVEPGGMLTWVGDLSDLGVDLSEHLGAGEFHLWPCSFGRERCRPFATSTRLFFLADGSSTSIGEGDVPAYASEAGRQLAERSGLLSYSDRTASGSSNLTVRVVKRSESTDWRPEPNEGRGGEE
jgi:hypothetical protein